MNRLTSIFAALTVAASSVLTTNNSADAGTIPTIADSNNGISVATSHQNQGLSFKDFSIETDGTLSMFFNEATNQLHIKSDKRLTINGGITDAILHIHAPELEIMNTQTAGLQIVGGSGVIVTNNTILPSNGNGITTSGSEITITNNSVDPAQITPAFGTINFSDMIILEGSAPAIPEPETLALAGVAVAGLLASPRFGRS